MCTDDITNPGNGPNWLGRALAYLMTGRPHRTSMDLPDPPKGFDLLVDQYAIWPKIRKQLEGNYTLPFLLGSIAFVILLKPAWDLNIFCFAFVILAWVGLLVKTDWKVNTTAKLIALENGHPWHDSDEATGEVGVAVWFGGPVNWMILEPDVRMWIHTPTLDTETSVYNGDSEGAVLGSWPEGMIGDERMKKVVNLGNQAQMLAAAQARPEGEEDPFEQARQREDGTSDLDLRTWEEPTPGKLMPQKGVLRRLLKDRAPPQEPEADED